MFRAILVSCTATVLASKVGKYFDHIMIVQFENHAYDEVIQDPNFNKYRALGRTMTNYFAVRHPSQPNYIAQAAGDTLGIADDDVHHISADNICLADLLEKKGVSWKLYQEDYPGNCDDSEVIGNYARKHNQFISFDSVRLNPARCAKIVNSEQLDKDLASGQLPFYSYFTPNMLNDAHNTNITFGGQWLDSFLTPRLKLFPESTLLFITWDEDDYTEENQILSFMLDPTGLLITPGTADNTLYNHYSLLASIEDNWSLGNMNRNDKNATLISFKPGNINSKHNNSRPYVF